MKKRKQKTAKKVTELEPGQGTPAEPTVEPTAEASAEVPSTEVDDELMRVSRERDQHLEQLQRTLADLQNFRKRRAQEMAEVRQAAVEALSSELLPVLDNFHLATEAGEQGGEDSKAVREGLAMVRAMLEGALERHGLREIPAKGCAFDHTVHEAVGIAEPNNDIPPGHVAQVIQRGYYMKDRVLRHAKVLVAGEAGPKTEPTDGS